MCTMQKSGSEFEKRVFLLHSEDLASEERFT